MARLYANENFPRQVVEALSRLGHDILTSSEAGNAGRGVPDEQVLAFAIANDRAVLTLNRRDFIRIHNKTSSHSGIIICTQDFDTDEQAKRIDAAIKDADTLRNKLIRVNRPQR